MDGIETTEIVERQSYTTKEAHKLSALLFGLIEEARDPNAADAGPSEDSTTPLP